VPPPQPWPPNERKEEDPSAAAAGQAAGPRVGDAPRTRLPAYTSITAYRGHTQLIDYSATKGAIVTFTRTLSQLLAERGIRVNGVAPGPIWTPLIPGSFDPEKVSTHGGDKPLGRPGQPNEVASCFVFLASEEASYMSGQVLHPNGGEIAGS
jgi:NAD(P)-dependent dehydrogenase (short-subunit alcohol dehydrogenase family)